MQGIISSPSGIHAQLPLARVRTPAVNSGDSTYVVLLACDVEQKGILAIVLEDSPSINEPNIPRGKDCASPEAPPEMNASTTPRVICLPYAQIAGRLRHSGFRAATLNIPLPRRNLVGDSSTRMALCAVPREVSFEARLCHTSSELLLSYGYTLVMGIDIGMGVRTLAQREDSPGVHLSRGGMDVCIHIGRCDCVHGRLDGTLGVIISSANAAWSDTTSTRAMDEPHSARHPVHVRSWSYHSGVASKTFTLTSVAGERTTLRLTVGLQAQSNPRARTYRLGIWV